MLWICNGQSRTTCLKARIDLGLKNRYHVSGHLLMEPARSTYSA